MTKITWKEHWPNIGPMSYQGWIGRIQIFTIRQSMIRGNSNWYLSSSLTGLTIKHSGSVDECKKHAAIGLQKWMEAAGIEA